MGEISQSNKQKKRRILLIKKKLQLHFGIVVFISVLLATAIVGWDIYYTINYKLLQFFTVDPDLSINLKLTNNLLLTKLVIYGIIVFLISFFISNKVAGPIFRFEQSCEEIGEGDLTYRVRLRKSDELVDLQDKFNLMVDSLQSKMQRIKHLGQEAQSGNTDKIKELREEINKQFKID